MAITWHRGYFEYGETYYEDDAGYFEITREVDLLMGGTSWWIHRKNEDGPTDYEPRYYLADAKAVCEAEIISAKTKARKRERVA